MRVSEQFQLKVTHESLEKMKADAIARFPNECCGFMLGNEKDQLEISEVIVVPNDKPGDQKREFNISADQYVKAELYALSNGLEVVGIYHSHPLHPAYPSAYDLEFALPNMSYLIISTFEDRVDDIRSFRLDENRNFIEELIS